MDTKMNDLIPISYVRKAQDAINTRNKITQNLLYHKKLPEESWGDKTIEDFMMGLQQASRHFSPANELVIRRNYSAFQGVSPFNCSDVSHSPESKLSQLANSFMSDLIKIMGVKRPFDCALVPVATGMSLIFSMLAFRSMKPAAKYVIWSRIDQKSCFKSIISAGFVPIIIDTICINNEYVTDVQSIEQKIDEIGVENINCVMSTTSCFAPRACDNIEAISEICKRTNIYHLVNNAYGLSNRKIMKRINKASLKSQIDVFVQSIDKNLCVPVGGVIIASFNKEIFAKFGEICSENMSVSPAIDVVITLLRMGKKKYQSMLDDCEAMYKYLKEEMSKLGEKYEEVVIENAGNPISIALTLSNVPKEHLTEIGSMLYTRNISGARVVTTTEVKSISEFKFERWGAHSNDCHTPYLTAAASIGILRTDVDIFIEKLDKILFSLRKKK